MNADGQGVLVLNKSWVAVHVASVHRAISLVYQDLAHVVSPEDYQTYDFDSWKELSETAESGYIRSVNFKLVVPEVIKLLSFNRLHMREVRFSRRNIFERDGDACQYCGKRFAKSELAIDHVLPRSRGGKSEWENVVLACVRCNTRKGNRLPREVGMKLIHRPVKPKWANHVSVRLGRSRRPSWRKFVDEAYWNVELTT